jgi:hypothetical protein
MAISNNYHLATGSPCIGAGVPLSTLTALTNNCPGIDHDINGVARTNTNGRTAIGAYTY